MSSDDGYQRLVTLADVNYIINPLRSALGGLTESMIALSASQMIHGHSEETRTRGREAFDTLSKVLVSMDDVQTRIDELRRCAGESDE